MTCVAVYTRLSHDQGQQTATARQEQACRAYADARGWEVAQVFEDVDLSAYRRGVTRPGYEGARVAAATGVVDGILVWKLDRLVRRPAEFERFWEACEKGQAFLASVTEPVDSSSEIGLAIVRILVTFAGLESTSSGMRIRAKQLERAKAGLPSGSTRPFGFTKDWKDIVPEEAAMIREAAARLLGGESLRSIATGWNERGTLPLSGRPWQVSHLSRLMKDRRLVGDRTWHGKEVVATDCFPAILDRLTHSRVRFAIAARAAPMPSRARVYLLTAVLRCGSCGRGMSARRCRHGASYLCRAEDCGHVFVRCARADEWVVDRLLNRTYSARRTLPRHRLTATVGGAADQLTQLNRDYYITGILQRPEYLQTRSEVLGVAVADLEGNIGLTGSRLPPHFDLRYIRTSWPSLDIVQRRAVIASQIETVTVRRTGKEIKFDPCRISIRWRSDDDPSPRSQDQRADRSSTGNETSNNDAALRASR